MHSCIDVPFRPARQSTFFFDSLVQACVFYNTAFDDLLHTCLEIELSKKPKKKRPWRLNWAYLFKEKRYLFKAIKTLARRYRKKFPFANNTRFVFAEAGTCPLSHPRCLHSFIALLPPCLHLPSTHAELLSIKMA